MIRLEMVNIGNTVFKCKISKNIFDLGTYGKDKDLNDFVDAYHKDGDIICRFCKKVFLSRRKLQGHWLKSHHRDGYQFYRKQSKCPVPTC